MAAYFRMRRQNFVMLLAITLLLWLTQAAGATGLDAPWSGSGTGTTTVTSDGTVSDPQFDYQAVAFNGNWTFSTVAAATGPVSVIYHSTGFYSYFHVAATLQRFISRNGVDILAEPLVAEGPNDCCTSPSGGFNYTGLTTFPGLQVGDVYGFRLSGSNQDAANTLQGTLTVSPPPSRAIDAPWHGFGTGTTTDTSDGTVTDPQFDYDAVSFNGSWQFSTVAASVGPVAIIYHSTGFYSYFLVTAAIQRFISRNGTDILVDTLVSQGPAICCDPPSGGFDYSGITTFQNLQPGDAYGFRLTGANTDAAKTLQGTLVLRGDLIFRGQFEAVP